MKSFNTHTIIDDRQQEVIVKYEKKNRFDIPEIVSIECGLRVVTDDIGPKEFSKIRREMIRQARLSGVKDITHLFMDDIQRTGV